MEINSLPLLTFPYGLRDVVGYDEQNCDGNTKTFLGFVVTGLEGLTLEKHCLRSTRRYNSDYHALHSPRLGEPQFQHDAPKFFMMMMMMIILIIIIIIIIIIMRLSYWFTR
jgi:hypothetical protein